MKKLPLGEALRRKRKRTALWIKNHPDIIALYDKKYLKNRAKSNSLRRRQLRLAAIIKLGGRCVSPDCLWVNADGTKGCTDFRILQFDHVKGGGTQERKKVYFEGLCKDVFADKKGKFQLLCANCN